jgi:hypothetical protein
VLSVIKVPRQQIAFGEWFAKAAARLRRRQIPECPKRQATVWLHQEAFAQVTGLITCVVEQDSCLTYRHGLAGQAQTDSVIHGFT